MKLASFKIGNSSTWGVIEKEEAIDVGALLRDRYPDLKSAIAADALPAARDATGEAKRYPTVNIAWLPVIPNPDKILCIGLNYETHRKETGRTERENPTVLGRFANNQTGHLTNIIRPKLSHDLDFEGELAVIIGKPGRHIARSDAWATSPAMPATTKAACVISSVIRISSRPARTFQEPALSVLDDDTGRTRRRHAAAPSNSIQRSNRPGRDDRSDDFRFPSPDRILLFLHPPRAGDVIAAGAPGGVGSPRTPPLWLNPDDIVEVEIDRLGVLRNGVADET